MSDIKWWKKVKGLDIEPSFNELVNGTKPEKVTITSEMNWRSDKIMQCATVMDINYQDEEIIFDYALFDISALGTFRMVHGQYQSTMGTHHPLQDMRFSQWTGVPMIKHSIICIFP